MILCHVNPFGYISIENLTLIEGENIKKPEKSRIPKVLLNFIYSIFNWNANPIDCHHIWNYVDSLSKIYINLYTIEDDEDEYIED